MDCGGRACIKGSVSVDEYKRIFSPASLDDGRSQTITDPSETWDGVATTGIRTVACNKWNYFPRVPVGFR